MTTYNEGGPVSSTTTPVVIWLEQGDLGYLVDALLTAAESRRERGSLLQERIADHLDELAIRLHEAKPAGIEPRR